MKDHNNQKKILQLIEENAVENVIQKELKTDLSIMSKVYAHPQEEYICFSEFPIQDGIADFVIFTGRSRMEVIIIEIKGANFNFSNSNHYRNMSFKMNEATQQIIGRFNAIEKNYNNFRVFVHKIRQQVESGIKTYNSLLCRQGYLNVDPNKDICVRGIVIGGRCTDDMFESNLRHSFEQTLNSRIRIESWDSWIRKLASD